MSIAIMTRVWSESPRQGAELLIELALADFANDQGQCWPSVETLAKKARCSERYVQMTVRKMVEDGSLAIEEGGGRLGTHMFTLLSRGVNSVHPELSSGGEPYFTGGVNRTSPGGEPYFTGGVNRTSPDPSNDPSIEPSYDPAPPARNVPRVSDFIDQRKKRRRAS